MDIVFAVKTIRKNPKSTIQSTTNFFSITTTNVFQASYFLIYSLNLLQGPIVTQSLTTAEPTSHSTITLSLQTLHFIGLTMIADSNRLVALTSALLFGSVSTQSSSIRSTQVSSNSKALENRLAALCVCEPRSEVIAIGCRFKKPTVELIIASNNGPPPPDSTCKHLNSIWESLHDISDRNLSGKELFTNPLAKPPSSRPLLAILPSTNYSWTSTNIILRWPKSAMRSIGLLWKNSANTTAVWSNMKNL